jgi:hypothetical protein
MLRLHRRTAGGANQTRNFGQSTQDAGVASLAFPIARDAFERASSQALSPRVPETIWRDAPASGDDIRPGSPGISTRATPLATGAIAGGEAFGPQHALRRQFAMAAAALAAQAMSDAEESSHRPLDALARWAPFLPTHAPLRARIREPYSPQTRSGRGPATDGAAFPFDSRNRSTGHSGPGADVMHAVYPSATSGLSFGDPAGGVDRPGVNRADRVIAARQFAQQLSEARFVSAFPRPDVVWRRALRLSVNPPLAQRLATHDEPFAPATRLMRAARTMTSEPADRAIFDSPLASTVVARKLAEFLGTSPPTTEQVAAKSAFRRIQPISATFAAGFSASTLPAPARRQPSPAMSAARNAPVDQSIAPWIPDHHPEAMALTPFVARQMARAEIDLRLASPMPISLPTARIQPTMGGGEPSPAASLLGRLLQRSDEVYPSSAVAFRGEAARPVVRPRRVSPGAPAASNDVNAGVVSSPARHSPPTGQDAIDPISRFHGALPFTRDFPGFPFVFTGTGRRQANLLSMHNRPATTSSFALLRQALAVDASPAHLASQGVYPATVPTGLASSPGAPARFDLPRFMRHAVASGVPTAAPGGGLVSRPLVFRSALPAAGEPSLAQRTEAAEAMAHSSGQPLPPLVRRSMEHLFRMDLATVRVHSGPHAARATDLVAARAMASGTDVFLPGGVSDSPHSADLPLLAHELTHVAHHFGRRPPSAPTAAPLTLAHRTASTEQDAERVERTVAETIRRQPAATGTPPALTLARKPAPVTIMRVDEATPASNPSPASTPGSATAAPMAGDAVNPPSKQDQQKLADQIFHMLEQRLIVARERGGHRL